MSQCSTAITGRPLVVGMPNVWNASRFEARVREILESKVFSNQGPFVCELERVVRELTGVKHCIAVANATLGLEIALRALSTSGEVIVPSFTYVATVNAIVNVGLKPVFCEVDRDGLLDIDHARRLINENTAAILPVNLFGLVCQTDEIADLAKSAQIKVLYDSAHALLCGRNGRLCGGFGDAEVFSLHATKFVNGFEGGLITTNDDCLAERMRRARNFGFDKGDIVDAGTNAKLSEIHAAMALTNLEGASEIREWNMRNFREYKARLPALFEVIEPSENIISNYHYLTIRCGDRRETIISALAKREITARSYFYPVHQFSQFRSHARLPRTEALSTEILSLPTGLNVNEKDIARVCEIIDSALSS